MGFLDDFNNVVEKKVLEQYEKIFGLATDYKLQEWWIENQYNSAIDERVKELAEKGLRRRHLSY